MQTRHEGWRYWATPAVGVLIGVVYLIAFWIGDKPVVGVFGLAVMVLFSAAAVLVARRSETVHGLLDRRDERITGIDLRATAVTAVVMIVVVLVGFVVEVARGHSGQQFALVGAAGGVAYLAAVAVLRLRG